MRQYDIFISYRREDGAQYARIVQLVLESYGYSAFLDYEELKGGKFGDKIVDAINSAPIFVMILTKRYLSRCWRKNDWVKKEIQHAINKKKKIIPLVPDGIRVNMPLFLNSDLKHAIMSEQYSHVDFGQQLKANISSMIKDRIEEHVNLNFGLMQDMPYSHILSYILDTKTHPVNYVQIDATKGLVETPFNALVIGFDKVGQDIFKFLYEFSAFVGLNTERIPFKCYAIDENMDNISGLICEEMPAIGEQELSLIQASINSDRFWSSVKDIITGLNYIVISIDDVRQAIYVLNQIIQMAKKYRNQDALQLAIMVRCNNRTRNEVIELNNLVDDAILIHPFVIDQSEEWKHADILKTKAKEFYWVYKNKTEKSPDEQWIKAFVSDNGISAVDRIINRVKRNGITLSQYDAQSQINCRKAQVYSEVIHSYTKMILMGFDEKDLSERLKLYYGYVDSRKYGTLDYDCNALDATLLKNMAIVEHERWIASHKLMGYTYASKNDHEKKHHKYLVSWKDLNTEEQSWDCDVVDTTIRFAYENSTKK